MVRIQKLTAVMRMHRPYPRVPANLARAVKDLLEMSAGIEYIRENVTKSVHVAVLTGDHPDADKWDTANDISDLFSRYPATTVSRYRGDPFYSALQKAIVPVMRHGASHMLVVSYTSIHLLTPRVVSWIRKLFLEGALCVSVVPPDIPTGIRGAANNQCTAWDLMALKNIGGFDPRDVKPHHFDMDRDIQGVGEAITAYKLGASTMGIIIPDVERGDTRAGTAMQEAKIRNKERRLEAWLTRDGISWDDLERLQMCAPINLARSRT
jgi:hypothetical protein